MENRYEEFWERPEVDWHEKIPHHYHVSALGACHAGLDPKLHYGPCMRQSFYKIVDPLPESPESKGNLRMGNILHEAMQKEEKLKNPNCVIEFPLYMEFERNNRKISISGSVDIVDFHKNCYPQTFDVIDIKSASEYTLPKDENDRNPTYFAQVAIYSYILQNFYFNPMFMKLLTMRVRYIAKHNAGINVVKLPYKNSLGKPMFDSFVDRCFEMDEQLYPEPEPDLILPDAEPMRWCGLCDYAARCVADVIYEKDIPEFTEEQVQGFFEKFTGRNVYWRGSLTKGYLKYREAFKIKDE